jgi:hypothetical protein
MVNGEVTRRVTRAVPGLGASLVLSLAVGSESAMSLATR